MKDQWLDTMIQMSKLRISEYEQHASREDWRYKQFAEIERHVLDELNKLKEMEK